MTTHMTPVPESLTVDVLWSKLVFLQTDLSPSVEDVRMSYDTPDVETS